MAIADLQRQILAWVEQRVDQGRPLQIIMDELHERQRMMLSDHRQPEERLRAFEAYNHAIRQLFNVMAERNERGRRLEKLEKVDQAIPLYQANIADCMQASLPYDRLRIIYTRQKRYEDAAWVCQAYLSLPDREHGQAKEHFRHHLEQLRRKIARER